VSVSNYSQNDRNLVQSELFVIGKKDPQSFLYQESNLNIQIRIL